MKIFQFALVLLALSASGSQLTFDEAAAKKQASVKSDHAFEGHVETT
jgi:hypothetical protein